MKNTAVAVGLLAISFGLYQYSLTEKPEIDPAMTPELNVSEGLGQDPGTAKSSTSPGIKSLASGSSFGGFDTGLPKLATPVNAPDFSANPNGLAISGRGSQVDAPNSTGRKPVVAATKNGVQSIQYPNDPASRDFSSQMPQPETRMSQREEVPSSLDQGLLKALQQDARERDQAGGVRGMANGGDFMARPFAAQSIASNKTELGNVTAQQVSATTQMGQGFSNPPSDGQTANGSAFDARVKQASVEPDFDELKFDAAWPRVDQLVAAGDFENALKLLSRFYRDADLSGPQRQRLLGWLDALAGKVIFSAENHLTAQPYTVGPNETLDEIAQKWKIPARLIANVNGSAVSSSANLPAGTQLKSIPGPFTAEVDLEAHVLTLFLGDLYAGRFPILLGISGSPKPGAFKVLLKSENGFSWRDSEGVEYPPESPQNGYGPNWIGLEGSLCLHAVSEDAKDGHHGCIGLSEADSQDVFGILSESSVVRIR